MKDKDLHLLRVDEGFKSLIRPLQKSEYLQLEANLLAEGCRDAIITWQDIIIDGHNRYEICSKHHIAYHVIQMEFHCREAVISWICANQLGRRNITEEARKFLIGMQYESEKLAHRLKNLHGRNQYSVPKADTLTKCAGSHLTAQWIAEENNICRGTVQKYATYTRALEAIGQKVPELVPKVLAGKCKISHKSMIELARLAPDEIRRIGAQFENNHLPFVQYSQSRQEINQSTKSESLATAQSVPSVKDMPAFDPDAEITGLILTIPSWISSIDRVRSKEGLAIASDSAKNKLSQALRALQNRISNTLSTIELEE